MTSSAHLSGGSDPREVFRYRPFLRACRAARFARDFTMSRSYDYHNVPLSNLKCRYLSTLSAVVVAPPFLGDWRTAVFVDSSLMSLLAKEALIRVRQTGSTACEAFPATTELG